jgi:hypothetical protein
MAKPEEKVMPASQPIRRPHVAVLASAFMVLVSVSAAASDLLAQQPAATALTLGDAARLAAKQSAPSLSARLRTREAAARVVQSRSELLPSVNALALQNGHTLNSATFGIDFPTPAGQKPFFDPNGEVIGPINTLDVRARVTVPAIDFAARERVTSARLAERASDASARSAAEDAAAAAASSAALRAEASLALSARRALVTRSRAAKSIAGTVTRARTSRVLIGPMTSPFGSKNGFCPAGVGKSIPKVAELSVWPF